MACALPPHQNCHSRKDWCMHVIKKQNSAVATTFWEIRDTICTIWRLGRNSGVCQTNQESWQVCSCSWRVLRICSATIFSTCHKCMICISHFLIPNIWTCLEHYYAKKGRDPFWVLKMIIIKRKYRLVIIYILNATMRTTDTPITIVYSGFR